MEFLNELRQMVQEKPSETDKILTSYFVTEKMVYIFLKNEPRLTRRDAHHYIRYIFAALMDRKLGSSDFDIIEAQYTKQPAGFFDIPLPWAGDDSDPEARDAHNAYRNERLDCLITNYYKVSMVDWNLATLRLLRNAPSHASHEFANRRVRYFRPKLSNLRETSQK